MGLSRSLSGGSRRGPFRRYRNAVVMLGRMIALHHRMTQNAADMMELIQETLNQADEAHSRRIHGGHDGVRHHHVRGLSLAESSYRERMTMPDWMRQNYLAPGFGIRSTRRIWLTPRRWSTLNHSSYTWTTSATRWLTPSRCPTASSRGRPTRL